MAEGRFSREIEGVVDAVLTTPGDLPPAVRSAVFARAFALAGGDRQGRGAEGEVPADAQSFVDKVARHAWKVTDEDVDALKAAGYSEDAIFELIVSTATGSGAGRLERSLAALDAATGRN